VVHDFRRTAVRNLELAGVSRSAAMKLTGHKTEAVYRRYAIVDSAMLQEAVDNLGALHSAEANYPSQPRSGKKLNGPRLQYGLILLYFCAHARVAERQTRWT